MIHKQVAAGDKTLECRRALFFLICSFINLLRCGDPKRFSIMVLLTTIKIFKCCY